MKNEPRVGAARSILNLKVFRDWPEEMDWAFRQRFVAATEHASEMGELLYLATKLDPLNREEWVARWEALGSRVEAQAEESLRAGHEISARDSFMRAHNYYGAAEYGSLPSEPQFHDLWNRSVQCFLNACRLFNPPIQVVEVPFEGKKLPGYFWRPDTTDRLRPTLVAAGGNESSLEQIFLALGPAAVSRGYNFFTFDYPGHRGAVHTDRSLIKRPDYEVPFKAAFDFLQTLPGVDDRIALAGLSYGGYVATRVAAFEPRVKAIIPNSPIHNLKSIIDAFTGPLVQGLPRNLLNQLFTKKVKQVPLLYSLQEFSFWTHGYDRISMAEWLESESLARHVVDLSQITCPALALVGENEGAALVKQATEFWEGISSRTKAIHVFTLENDGCSDHCQIDNRGRSNQVALDWLDDVFDYRGSSAPS